MENIYNAIQNVYNMDKTTWQEVLAELYNLVSNVENKFDLFETKFGSLLGEEVTIELKKMYDNGSLSTLINTKVDTLKTEFNEQLDTKANLDSIFSMANMGQDVKEAMTGGSVAVVGKNSVLTENIVDKQVTRNKTNFYSISKNGNLIDKDAIIKGKHIDNTGLEKNGNNETDFIPIDLAKTYRFNFVSYISFWNVNREFINGYIQGSVTPQYPVDLNNIPSDAKYVRLSVFDEDLHTCVFSELSVFSNQLTTKFIDNGLILGENNLEKSLLQKINSTSTTITGKTINFLGDSITYGFDGTNSSRVSKPYPTLVGEILGVRVNNYGISGSTIGGDDKTSTKHNILGYTPMNIRYVDMDNADYVIVLGGVNDYTADRRIPLGVKGDNTNLTFYGALKILIEGLIAKYPNSRIGFITPLRKIDDHSPNVYGNHLKEYRNAIIEMCEEYSIPVLDLFTKGGCYANISDWRGQNLPDGLHPNQSFYEKMAIQISSFIESI